MRVTRSDLRTAGVWDDLPRANVRLLKTLSAGHPHWIRDNPSSSFPVWASNVRKKSTHRGDRSRMLVHAWITIATPCERKLYPRHSRRTAWEKEFERRRRDPSETGSP